MECSMLEKRGVKRQKEMGFWKKKKRVADSRRGISQQGSEENMAAK